MQGEEISFDLRDNVVYDELYEDPDNVWNVMLAAGYLTAVKSQGKTIYARIPNKEVLTIYQDQISSWFRDASKTFKVRELYRAMEEEDPERIQELLTDQFLSAMSYYDTVEAFYHGVLLTLLQLNQAFKCDSNRESGEGRFDIMAKRKARWDLAFVFEVKISKRADAMITAAKKAAAQVEKKKYIRELQREGYARILTYGISFCDKRCRVVQGKTFSGSAIE